MIGPRPTRDRFRYHVPSDEKVLRAHETVRAECARLATLLDELLPPCREKDSAVDAVDLAAMWSNAAVARTQLRDA